MKLVLRLLLKKLFLSSFACFLSANMPPQKISTRTMEIKIVFLDTFTAEHTNKKQTTHSMRVTF